MCADIAAAVIFAVIVKRSPSALLLILLPGAKSRGERQVNERFLYYMMMAGRLKPIQEIRELVWCQ